MLQRWQVLAADLAQANGFGDVIEVIHGDLMDIELPEKVDVTKFIVKSF